MTYTSNQPVWFPAVPPNAESGGLFGRLADTLLALALLQTGPANPSQDARTDCQPNAFDARDDVRTKCRLTQQVSWRQTEAWRRRFKLVITRSNSS